MMMMMMMIYVDGWKVLGMSFACVEMRVPV